MTICTNDMELAGNLVQALVAFLNIDNLASTCEFPAELAKLESTLQKVEDFNATRQTMLADMADHSSLIRSFIVQAEDSRLIHD